MAVSAIPECDMRFTVLGSGSQGNSVYIESGKTAVLLDAGFSGTQLCSRLNGIGREMECLNGILLTHEHNDHIRGAGVLSRRCKIPVFANDGTFNGGEKKLGKLHKRMEFETGEKFVFRDLEIRSFRILHDTSDPVGYVISDGQYTLGYCTDTGKVTHLMAARLANCDALILEFNHDPEMLRLGPYPPVLQQRVRSSHGHLANDEAADFLGQLLNRRLQYVVLAHLSETNNLPRIAYDAALKAKADFDSHLILAEQHVATALIDLTSAPE
jgi:phosphoribosyl 1,2-cyclic phosphodiesterase